MRLAKLPAEIYRQIQAVIPPQIEWALQQAFERHARPNKPTSQRLGLERHKRFSSVPQVLLLDSIQ